MNLQRLNFLRGRAGRVLLFIAALLLFTALMLVFAAVMYEYDPDGRHFRNWSRESRPWLFVWRMMLYSSLAIFWIRKVRPAMLKRWPEESLRIRRTELLVVIYLLGGELLVNLQTLRESMA
jgi:hypothetical protein